MNRRFLNGETWLSKPQSSYTEYIAYERVTRGTETSKYPEEEKETSIPSVAASESGRAQTVMRASRGSDCIRDSVTAGERLWNSRPERVRAPYPKPELTRQDPEYHGTRETLWERAETTP